MNYNSRSQIIPQFHSTIQNSLKL